MALERKLYVATPVSFVGVSIAIGRCICRSSGRATFYKVVYMSGLEKIYCSEGQSDHGDEKSVNLLDFRVKLRSVSKDVILFRKNACSHKVGAVHSVHMCRRRREIWSKLAGNCLELLNNSLRIRTRNAQLWLILWRNEWFSAFITSNAGSKRRKINFAQSALTLSKWQVVTFYWN